MDTLINKELVIRHISSPTPAGCLAVMVGDGFESEGLEVLLSPVFDREISLPGEFHIDDNSDVRADILSIGEGHTITFKIPEGQYCVWTVRVKSKDMESNKYIVNTPEVKWISTEKAFEGQEIRVFGMGLVGIDEYPVGTDLSPVSYGGYIEKHKAAVVFKDSCGVYKTAEITKASSYDIHVRVPESLQPGTCEVYVHNGHGGVLGWSKPQNIEIIEEIKWPQKIFNIVEYGAKAVDALDVLAEDNIDNTKPVQAALNAAEKNGGGIVIIPSGRYRFYGSLFIPRHTVLKGEDPKRVWLELPKGLSGEDGWGTPEEGMNIKAFLCGEGEFGVENINILSVYTPIIIAAPVLKELPVLSEEKYNKFYGFGNMIDSKKDANHVFIKNCCLYQEPTYFSQRKSNVDPIFCDEKWDGQNNETKLFFWAAIAIKGLHIEIEDCVIKGGGTPVVLMASQYSRIANNKLYSGNYACHITMFSSSYNSLDPWHRLNKNIIIEDNEMYVASNLNRSANWIMSAHTHYYIARNYIGPLFWHSDCEGLCFHHWGGKYLLNIENGASDAVMISDKSIQRMYWEVPESHSVFEAEGRLKAGQLKGWECIIIRGKGLGQYRTISDNTKDILSFDEAWVSEPDETSILCVCEFPMFHHTLMIDNETNEGGRSLYYWGDAFESVMDGNVARRNSNHLLV